MSLFVHVSGHRKSVEVKKMKSNVRESSISPGQDYILPRNATTNVPKCLWGTFKEAFYICGAVVGLSATLSATLD